MTMIVPRLFSFTKSFDVTNMYVKDNFLDYYIVDGPAEHCSSIGLGPETSSVRTVNRVTSETIPNPCSLIII